MPASRAMPIALVITIALAMVAWGVPALQISASVIKGLIIAAPWPWSPSTVIPMAVYTVIPAGIGMFLAW